jgi:hypothetical protein
MVDSQGSLEAVAMPVEDRSADGNRDTESPLQSVRMDNTALSVVYL